MIQLIYQIDILPLSVQSIRRGIKQLYQQIFSLNWKIRMCRRIPFTQTAETVTKRTKKHWFLSVKFCFFDFFEKRRSLKQNR